MNNRYVHNFVYVSVTFVFACLLSIIPLDAQFSGLRPHWLLLTLLFWQLVWPLQIGVGWAFMVGVWADLVQGTLLGQHALAFSLTVYVLSGGYHRMRLYSIWQQVPVVLFLVTIHQLVVVVVQRVLGDGFAWSQVILPALTSALFWPALCVILNRFKQRFIRE